MPTSLNWEHLTALLLLGIGAVLLTLSNHLTEAMLLYGVLGGYAFKNGVYTNSVANPTAVASSATTHDTQTSSTAT